jgi:hypothetical protein
MPSVGFEPAIPATKRPQTYALDRAATGIGSFQNTVIQFSTNFAELCQSVRHYPNSRVL